MVAIATCRRLITVRYHNSRFGEAAARALARNPLENVVVVNNPAFGDAAVAALLDCRTVRNLQLVNVGLTPAAATLGRMPWLRALDVRGVPFADAAADQFFGLKNLVTLELHGTRMTPASAETLATKLPTARVILGGRTIEPREKR